MSHDLRSPLASAKASVTSLRSDRIQWTDEARAELLLTADESLDRLTELIENLLDMSRLEAGALGVHLGPAALDELVPLVLDALGPEAADVLVDVPETLPEVCADAVLLERVLVNLLGNALRYSPAGRPPLVAASEHAGARRAPGRRPRPGRARGRSASRCSRPSSVSATATPRPASGSAWPCRWV